MPEAEIEVSGNAPVESKIDVRDSSHGLASVYSNRFDVMWTPHDVKMKFSELIKIVETTTDSPRTNVYEERVHVVVSWIQAKALAVALTELVSRYEAVNGEIKVPKLP